MQVVFDPKRATSVLVYDGMVCCDIEWTRRVRVVNKRNCNFPYVYFLCKLTVNNVLICAPAIIKVNLHHLKIFVIRKLYYHSFEKGTLSPCLIALSLKAGLALPMLHIPSCSISVSGIWIVTQIASWSEK